MRRLIEKIKKSNIKRINKIKQNPFVSRLLKNMFISFVGEGGATVVAFFSTVILIWLIGNKNYGILAVAYSFITIIDTFVNFQAWHAMVTFGSEALGEKNYGALERLIKIGSIIDFSTAALGMGITIATASLFGNLFGWNDLTIQCIYILAFKILFNFTGTSIGIIRLLDKFKLFSIYRIVTEVIRLVLIVLFCGIFKMGLKGAAFAYTLAYICGYSLLFIMFLNELSKNKNISIRRIITSNIKQDWKKVFQFTFWTSMTASADIPVQQFDIIFLSVLSYDIVAVFKVYKQIGQLLSKFTTPLKQAVMPLFSELISQGKRKECYVYFKKMKSKGNLIMVPLVLLTTIASLIFMYFALDEIYITYWYILLIYLFLRGFALTYAPIHPLFIALGQVKKNFIISSIANIVYVLIVWISIGYLGIWAILLGLSIEYFIVLFTKQKIVEKFLTEG